MDAINGNGKANNIATWIFRVLLTVGLFGVIGYLSKQIDQNSLSVSELRLNAIKTEVRTDYLEIRVSKLPPQELVDAVKEIKEQVGENSRQIISVSDNVIRIATKLDVNIE